MPAHSGALAGAGGGQAAAGRRGQLSCIALLCIVMYLHAALSCVECMLQRIADGAAPWCGLQRSKARNLAVTRGGQRQAPAPACCRAATKSGWPRFSATRFGQIPARCMAMATARLWMPTSAWGSRPCWRTCGRRGGCRPRQRVGQQLGIGQRIGASSAILSEGGLAGTAPRHRSSCNRLFFFSLGAAWVAT